MTRENFHDNNSGRRAADNMREDHYHLLQSVQWMQSMQSVQWMQSVPMLESTPMINLFTPEAFICIDDRQRSPDDGHRTYYKLIISRPALQNGRLLGLHAQVQ